MLKPELIVHDVTQNLRRNRSDKYVNRRELIVNDVTRNVNRLRFIQIPSKRLKKDTSTQVNNSTFIFELFFCKKIPLSRRVGYVMDGSMGQ